MGSELSIDLSSTREGFCGEGLYEKTENGNRVSGI